MICYSTKIDHDKFLTNNKPLIHIYICVCVCVCVGPKGSRGFGPFHIKPKSYAKEEEVFEEEWRESRLPDCTAENDPVLGRPKSQERNASRRPRHSPRGSQKRFQALWASHRSMVEKQPQEKLSPPC